MKVLLTALWPVGGIRTFFRYVYGNACFSDVALTLVSPDLGMESYLASHLPPGRIRFIPTQQTKGELFARTASALLREKYDLVHSHGFSASVVTEAARMGRRLPHLMTAHDVFLPGNFNGRWGNAKRLALQIVFRRLDAIHAVSNDGAANLREYLPGLQQSRVRAILHGIDTGMFDGATRRDVRGELGLATDSLIIGFFGRFMAQKGFRTLVDAVRQIQDQKMTTRPVKVLTFSHGGFIREDYAYLESKGLAPHFLKMPETHEPGSWMKGVDVIAMPSRWEACGLVGMEALCAGAPIVGTNCIGLREVLRGSPAQMVDPEDPASLARALIESAEPGRKVEFEAYQSEAILRFSIDRPAREIRAFYDELSARGGSVGSRPRL